MKKLRYRYDTYNIGEYRIRLRLLRDLDQLAEASEPVSGVSREAFPLFGIVWSSSELLAHLVLSADIENRRILEVGCGMALASHVLSARGANITAVDIHPLAGDLLQANSALNGFHPVPFVAASWSDDSLDLGSFDLIIASDVLYEPRHSVNLAPFIERHLVTGGEVLIVDPDRGQLGPFLTAMADLGLQGRGEPVAFVDKLGVDFPGKVFRFSRGESTGTALSG